MLRYVGFSTILILIFSATVSLYAQNPILQNLPEDTWYSVPNSKMEAVFPPFDPVYWGVSGPRSVISAWGGGTYDPVHYQMVLWGGGHSDYYGNEIYVFKIDSLKWHRITDPSQPNLNTEVNSDGTPISRHTYNGLAYISHANRFFARGGSRAGDGFETFWTWTFDFNNKHWQHMDASGNPPDGGIQNCAIYDMQTHRVFFGSNSGHGGSGGLFSYDFDNNAWTQHTSDDPFYAQTMAIDTERRLLFAIGNGRVVVYDIGKTPTVREVWTTTGGDALVSAPSPGVAYDPKVKGLVAWDGGPIYFLNVETRNWSTKNPPNTPTTQRGPFGRWRYIPRDNVFIAITSATKDVSFYKNTAGAGSGQTTPWISINDVETAEGDVGSKKVVFTVGLATPSSEVISVNYATSDGTAFANSDYEATSGTLTFTPWTTVKTITVTVNGDFDDESTEVFFVNLSDPVNASILDSQGKCNIINDDNLPNSADIIQVGTGKAYSVPSEAAAVAVDGDTIEIDAGRYVGDVAVWRQNNLTIRGVNGQAHLMANGKNAEGKGTWVIKGNNTIVENIEFSGATVSDLNGAGIRQEGTGLTVRNCYFHDNQEGILTGSDSNSDILIEHSEFANNGYGDGQSHNIYVNNVRSFTLRYSYIHHAKIGHNVKTRAEENFILYNRIMDEIDGTSSYAVDLPNGGISYLIGNLIQQGPNADNSTIVSFGAEGLKNKTNEFYAVNNTIVNDRFTGTFVYIDSGASVSKLINNLFVGSGTVLRGPGELITNMESSTDPGFLDITGFNYRLTTTSSAIDAGSLPGSANGFDLTPTWQYVHPLGREERNIQGTIDVGAYEFTDNISSVKLKNTETPRDFELKKNFPNPFNAQTIIPFTISQSGFVTLKIFNVQGKLVATLLSEELPAGQHSVNWDAKNSPSGVYFYRLEFRSRKLQKKLLLIK